MFQKFKEIFKNKDDKKLTEAEKDFDDRMAEVDEVIEDLTKLDKHLQGEYGEMHANVDTIRKEVDEVVGGKAA